jgi:hypothetical protein
MGQVAPFEADTQRSGHVASCRSGAEEQALMSTPARFPSLAVGSIVSGTDELQSPSVSESAPGRQGKRYLHPFGRLATTAHVLIQTDGTRPRYDPLVSGGRPRWSARWSGVRIGRWRAGERVAPACHRPNSIAQRKSTMTWLVGMAATMSPKQVTSRDGRPVTGWRRGTRRGVWR